VSSFTHDNTEVKFTDSEGLCPRDIRKIEYDSDSEVIKLME